MSRVGAVLACLLGFSGCVGWQGSEAPATGAVDQALAAAGSGGSKVEPGSVKSDCVSSTEDAYSACVTKAKECYSYEKDPAVCQKLNAQCEALNAHDAPKPAGADCDRDLQLCYQKLGKSAECDVLWKKCSSEPRNLPPAPLDDYTSCLIKAKECSVSSTDLTVCDEILKNCEAVKPEPANASQASDDAHAACQQKVKECYNSESDSAICDAEWKRCDSLLKPELK